MTSTKKLKSKSIAWFSGLDVNLSQYENTWINIPCKGLSDVEKGNVFVHNAKLINGEKYGYSLINFVTSKIKVKIICPEHGIYEQTPNHHLKGRGCPDCADMRFTTEEFIQKSKLIHGDRYDYSLVEYSSMRSKVKIICLEHGIFNQVTDKHVIGHGCPKCNRDVAALTQIYLVRFVHKKTGQSYHKIGLTERDEGLRPYSTKTRKCYYITLEDFFTVNTEDALLVERTLLAASRSKYGMIDWSSIEDKLPDGHTEMIPYNVNLVADFDDWGEMYNAIICR